MKGFEQLKNAFRHQIRHKLLNDYIREVGDKASEKCPAIVFGPPTGRKESSDSLSLTRVAEATTDQATIDKLKAALRDSFK